MLVLTRRCNERIFIDENIVVTVLDIENNRIKLGISAPENITILREEIRPARSETKPATNSAAYVAGAEHRKAG